jgi:hypothetical protein
MKYAAATNTPPDEINPRSRIEKTPGQQRFIRGFWNAGGDAGGGD